MANEKHPAYILSAAGNVQKAKRALEDAARSLEGAEIHPNAGVRRDLKKVIGDIEQYLVKRLGFSKN